MKHKDGYEVLEKLSQRTIEFFSDDLSISIEQLGNLKEVDEINYNDITTLISLTGDIGGTVGMSVSSDFSKVMAEAFLFGDATQEEIDDLSTESVAETLNVTLGNIIDKLSIIQNGGKVDILSPYTMHNSVTITKKKNGFMLISKLKFDKYDIILSYFV
jgi:CheY-specific phosphatase CheX